MSEARQPEVAFQRPEAVFQKYLDRRQECPATWIRAPRGLEVARDVDLGTSFSLEHNVDPGAEKARTDPGTWIQAPGSCWEF